MTPDKKAILAVSFGTSHADTRAAAISAIEQRIRSAHPDIPLYSAWTSQMIIESLHAPRGSTSVPYLKHWNR